MPTIEDVAVLAGVSTATVSRYISGVRIRNAATVQAAIDELGYFPNQTARTLKSGITGSIGVVVPDVLNPFFAAVVKGVESVSQQSSLTVYLSNTDESTEREREVLLDLVSRVDGVILAPAREGSDNTVPLREAGIPVVLVDRRLEGRDDLDCVRVDSRGGVAEAVRYLVDLGHTRIGFISGPLDTTPGRERYEGFSLAMEEAGLEIEGQLVELGDFRQPSGYQGALRLLGHPDAPTALIVANNLMTMGALQALRSMAISVPGQISVIGFDDIALAELLNPPLTVVDRPMMQQGVLAMRLLSRCIRSEVTHEAQDIILETRLTKRGSCAPMGGAQGRKG